MVLKVARVSRTVFPFFTGRETRATLLAAPSRCETSEHGAVRATALFQQAFGFFHDGRVDRQDIQVRPQLFIVFEE